LLLVFFYVVVGDVVVVDKRLLAIVQQQKIAGVCAAFLTAQTTLVLGVAYGAQPSTTMCVYMTCICDFVTLTVGQCVTGRLRPGLCERVAVALLAHAGSWREM
jgi:hypothetical protein